MEMSVKEKDEALLNIKGLLLIVVITAIAGIMFQNFYKIGINQTLSLPHLFYLIEKNPSEIKRNDIIEFDYYNKNGNGERFFYDNHVPFVKILAGVPGDEIMFKGDEFYINVLATGRVKELSTSGKPLTPNKSKTLGEDEYFLYTPSKDSFDSRYAYVGYVNREQITGKVKLKWFNQN